MTKLGLAIPFAVLVACGGSDSPGDSGGGGATVTVSGTAVEVSAAGMKPLAGVLVGAYNAANETTAVVTTMTDATGNYSLEIPKLDKPVDGFLKATKDGFMVTYLYPPAALAGDFDKASINMVTTQTFSLLANNLCNANQDMAKGAIGVLVVDTAGAAIGGAMVSSTPAASTYCYNANGLPTSSATMTAADGIAYMFNVTGNATVSATKAGTTFKPHGVNAHPGALTTTLITN